MKEQSACQERDERRETKDERRETKDERRKTKDERRETKDERRETRDERREIRGYKGDRGDREFRKFREFMGYSLLTTHYSLLSTLYSLLSTLYSLLSTHYSLLTTLYFLSEVMRCGASQKKDLLPTNKNWNLSRWLQGLRKSPRLRNTWRISLSRGLSVTQQTLLKNNFYLRGRSTNLNSLSSYEIIYSSRGRRPQEFTQPTPI